MVADQSWPVADLRRDWAPGTCLIDAVTNASVVYAPSIDTYIQCALDPGQAPATAWQAIPDPICDVAALGKP